MVLMDRVFFLGSFIYIFNFVVARSGILAFYSLLNVFLKKYNFVPEIKKKNHILRK